MAKSFIDKDFLLESDIAVNLYKACEKQPIYDYHCHLSPKEIADNASMKDLCEAWLSHDHYKWRMMRAMGIEKKYITGDASGYEKFLAWARTVENLIGNPLYHWTHLELQRYFNIYEPLTEKSAPDIWEKANTLLKTPLLSVKGIFEKFNIHTVGTTDDPTDDLAPHKAITLGKAAIGKINTKVVPTFRPDNAFNIIKIDYLDYINKLSLTSGIKIKTYTEFLAALERRLEYFIDNGCRSADHSFNYIPALSLSFDDISKAFLKALSGKDLTIAEIDSFEAMTLIFLSTLYAKKNIVMQIHTGVQRNINTKAFKSLGANTGFDAVNDYPLAENTARLLNAINSAGDAGIPKTILYSLHPKDYYPLLTVLGGFQGEGIKGKMQLGSAWWFCDNKDGMEEHLRALANLGVLPAFVGMLTDSRSFLSYSRHEYFRRILCNLISKWVENGEYPANMEKLEQIVKDIAFNNANNYFSTEI